MSFTGTMSMTWITTQPPKGTNFDIPNNLDESPEHYAERSQSEMVTYCMIPFIWQSWNDKIRDNDEQISGCQELRDGSQIAGGGVLAHHGKRRANEKKPTSTTHGAVDKAHRWEDRGREAKHKEPREATAWTWGPERGGHEPRLFEVRLSLVGDDGWRLRKKLPDAIKLPFLIPVQVTPVCSVRENTLSRTFMTCVLFLYVCYMSVKV